MQAAPQMTQLTENVLAESFLAMHFRNLAGSFGLFLGSEKWPQDVIAKNFVKDSVWLRRQDQMILRPWSIERVARLAIRRPSVFLQAEENAGRWPCVSGCALSVLVDFAKESDTTRRPQHLLEEINKLRALVGDIPGADMRLPEQSTSTCHGDSGSMA